MRLWGGRFSQSVDECMRQFNDSIAFDQRLFQVDIIGSKAYAGALQRVGLLDPQEHTRIVQALDQVRKEMSTGDFEFQPEDEDIHTAIERRLGELVGALAGKLHTGRSRNDQVATDLRLYVLDAISSLRKALVEIQRALVQQAEQHEECIMPGYTHMQQAQPVRFAHWMMSYFWRLQRDRERLEGVRKRTAVLPLGAGALVGNPFDIDRSTLAAELGLDAVSENSIDAVGDRDFVVEFLSWAALLQLHLSSLAEDLLLFSSQEFAFVELDERYATGSSLMPQKRNPDSLELTRGKAGRISGHLMAMLTTLKGLPSGYNKDLQEDKEGLFDTVDTLAVELPVVAGVIATLKVNPERMLAALDESALATDLADYLVDKGIPFRQSHQLLGAVVKLAEELRLSLSDLPLSEYQTVHPLFDSDLYGVLDFERSVERRSVRGGTALEAVRMQISAAKTVLEN